MYNTLLIKRRVATSSNTGIPVLSGGELAYDEKLNVLYYGSGPSEGPINTITIAGSGAYVTTYDDGQTQNVYGAKTFSNLTTLSSTTFSTNSNINAGNNAIHQVVAVPGAVGVSSAQAGTDAANISFVQNLSSWLDTYYVNRGVTGQTADQTAAGVKTYTNNAIFQQQVDVTGVVTASAGHITGNLQVDGNTTINGDLTVLGTTTQIDTLVHMTSAMDITNTGTGPALKVTQTGDQAIAAFYDDSNAIALYVDGASARGGNIGIGTVTPNEKLTVVGNVSATGHYFGVNELLTGTLTVSGVGAFGSNVTIVGNLSGNTSSGVPISRLEGWIVDCGTF